MLGENIKAAREAKGKSVSWLAGKLKVSRVAVVHWEAGTNSPRYSRLKTIARALGVTVADLISERQ